MATYNTTYLDFMVPPVHRREEEQHRMGNNWHQKMGFQKPANLDQAISSIKSAEYAPFTRELEQPSIASLYIQQTFGNMSRTHQEPHDYTMEDAATGPSRTGYNRRPSNSPDRGGIRRPGPEWGNTHFGAKPGRRGRVEQEPRAITDDNAPPLRTFYDEMAAAERQQHMEDTSTTNNHQASLTSTANGTTAPAPRLFFDSPTAIRVSNYHESRWPDVLQALVSFGSILERFDELRSILHYEMIPTKILAESDDPVVRQARLLFTGDGWTKVTFATREAADNAISQSGRITVGGRNLVIEAWKPEIHGGPTGTGVNSIFNRFEGPPATIVESAGSASFFDGTSVTAGLRQRPQQSIFSDPFATPVPNRLNAEPRVQATTPGGSKLSTQMRGAKVIQLKEIPGGLFKQKPGLLSRIISWIWGEVGPGGPTDEPKETGWMAWFTEKLFGKL